MSGAGNDGGVRGKSRAVSVRGERREGGVIAVVGAESTGKSTLAVALAEALRRAGHHAVAVDEFLREFCARERRTPRRDEQAAIAAEQTARIAAAAAGHAIVVADTTALMTAVYSDLLFDDASLYAEALDAQRGYALTLVTAIDLPWQADGLQRDGPHVRGPVDAKVRAALAGAGIATSTVAGLGDARLHGALRIAQRVLPDPAITPPRRGG